MANVKKQESIVEVGELRECFECAFWEVRDRNFGLCLNEDIKDYLLVLVPHERPVDILKTKSNFSCKFFKQEEEK